MPATVSCVAIAPSEPLERLLGLYPALADLREPLRVLAAQALTVPAGTVLFRENEPCRGQEWLAQPAFRSFVLGLFAERMADLSALVDAVAFRRLDQRLAAALLGQGAELAVTHQKLAERLGTVREIVTRLLHRFEQEGWVELSRERIRVRDSAALRSLAGPA